MVIKTNKLLKHTAKAAVSSEIHKKKRSTQSEEHVEFFNVKPDGA
jgi:hypothetical protein